MLKGLLTSLDMQVSAIKWCILLGIAQTNLLLNAKSVTSFDNRVCLKGKHHKPIPEPEADLGQCVSWETYSCCTNRTAKQISMDKSPLYKFNYSHCGKMSQKCLSWFIKNHCFYECSPNLGPWLKPVQSSYRQERFENLPLCKRDCDSWWDACKFDKTCTINWSKGGFVWSKDGNACPNHTECKEIQTLFGNATFFCENIYGPHDYKVVSVEQCMLLNFTGENPNTKIARVFAAYQQNSPFPSFHVTSTPVLQTTGTIVSVVLASLVVAIAICVALVAFVRWVRHKPFWHNGVPFQFKQLIPSKKATVRTTNESEMSFMHYDEDDEEEPELNGSLRMEL